MKVIFASLILILLVSLFFLSKNTNKEIAENTVSKNTSPNLSFPVKEFKTRITKKSFGTYVTPKNSPVKPERFTGHHTAVDIEYGDVKEDVSVHAIADGQIVYSSWAQGYGGVIAIRHNINQQPVVVIYGHLNPKSMLPNKTEIKKDQTIGILGKAYSTETDNERKHLHFGIG